MRKSWGEMDRTTQAKLVFEFGFAEREEDSVEGSFSPSKTKRIDFWNPLE